MAVANTLTYYDMATITALKSFIGQAPGAISNSVYYLQEPTLRVESSRLSNTKLGMIILGH